MRGGGRRSGHGGLVGRRRLVAVGIAAGEHAVVGIEGALAGVPPSVLHRGGLA